MLSAAAAAATETTTPLAAGETTTLLATTSETPTGLTTASNSALDYIKRLMNSIKDDEETLLEKTGVI